ncbi:anti-phage dCTP deaminase [Pseudomonadota bacterium]
MKKHDIESETPSKKISGNPIEIIEQRKAKELVIGFCGAVGCGIHNVHDSVKATFEKPYGYECVPILLSDVIQKIKGEISYSDEFERITKLQDAGNDLRKTRTTGLVEFAIAKIRSVKGVHKDPDGGENKPASPNERRIFLVDQLKHPDEVSLLKKIYGSSFYLFGVLSTQDDRVNRLKKSGMTDDQAHILIQRDEKEKLPHGQKVRDTIQHSDFFVRHSSHRNQECLASIQRFISLMLGEPIITPTPNEYAMYEAYSASLRSSCLSRQVGASIVNDNNHLISTGYNDVPSYNGGLYGRSNDASGERCFEKEEQCCFNDCHKLNMYQSVANDISSKVLPLYTQSKIANFLKKNSSDLMDKYEIKDLDKAQLLQHMSKMVAEKVEGDFSRDDLIEYLKKTKIKSLLEFSRSIHAEMEAILAAGRKSKSVVGGDLYCTTFPCHNCARHIIAAGISTVYYIEPYEKSLALDLHDDAITLLEDKQGCVKFLHFEGVAPGKYYGLFKMSSPRKKSDGSGEMIPFNHQDASPVMEKYLDSVVDYESVVVEKLREEQHEATQRVMEEAS